MWIIREKQGIIRTYFNYDDAIKRYDFITRNIPEDDVELYHLDDKNKDGEIVNCLKSIKGRYFDILTNISKIIEGYMKDK